MNGLYKFGTGLSTTTYRSWRSVVNRGDARHYGETIMINLTPHDINFYQEGECVATFPKTGAVARVSTETVDAGVVPGTNFPVIKTVYGEVEGVPALPCEPFLVSGMVLGQLGQEYSGIAFAPATGPQDGAIRNDKGHIVGVTKFVTV